MQFNSPTNKVWKGENIYLVDKTRFGEESCWRIFCLEGGIWREEKIIKCLDVWEVINTLYAITKEAPLFRCDLDEGVAVNCC